MKRDDHKPVKVELFRCDPPTTKQVVDDVITGGTKVGDTQTVDGDGKFSFGRVKKGANNTGSVPDTGITPGLQFKYNDDILYVYYLVFYYDGERYEPTIYAGDSNLEKSNKYNMKLPDFPNDSNAKEITKEREEFNASLETISYNKASPSGKALSYDKVGSNLQQSILLWDGKVDGVITMKAHTIQLFYNGGVDGDETEYLKYINLGLIERPVPDLCIEKDVVKAEVTINNHKTVYKYGKLGTKPYVDEAPEDHVLDQPYSLTIYREDYEYRTSKYHPDIQNILNTNNRFKDFGRDNDLNILVTYKITVTNDSKVNGVNAKIRDVVDYYSNELTIVNTTKGSIGGSSYGSASSSGGKYTVTHISGLEGTLLKPGDKLEFEVTYRALKNSDGYIYKDRNTEGTDDCKMNVAEIGAYSIYKESGDPYGLVDQDSNPGNIETRGDLGIDPKTMEDDSFETGIQFLLKDNPQDPKDPDDPSPGEKCYRNISGTVFEEIDKSVTADSDYQIVGNGSMDGNDRGAKNVLVKLYEVVRETKDDGSVEEEYYVDTGCWYRTGKDGKYSFGDKTERFAVANLEKPTNNPVDTESKDDCYKIHAGIYVVRFIYGDEDKFLITEDDGNTIRYSGQDFKSTQYKDVGNVGDEGEIVKPNVYTSVVGTQSVAKDNEVRRLEVNQYSTTTTYPMDTILKSGNLEDPSVLSAEEKDLKEKESKILAEHTGMFADTKAIDLDIEHIDKYGGANVETVKLDGTNKDLKIYKYEVSKVNFGLIERPRTKLQLMNDITEVKAVTSDGDILIDLFFDVYYTKCQDNSGKMVVYHTTKVNEDKSIGKSNVQVLNRKGANQGFRYANIDTDVLQGMVITIGFRTSVANISEVDHLSKYLEEEIEGQSLVDLKVKYLDTDILTGVAYDGTKVTDKIYFKDKKYSEEREYDYQNSYLYKLLYSGDSTISTLALRKADDTGKIYTYGTLAQDVGSKNVKKAYTYTNMIKKVDDKYKPGKYLGKMYYTDKYTEGEELQVKTKVDQYVDYVDNDLVFKPEENKNSNGQITYLTYTTKEIAKKGLLRDVIYGEDEASKIVSVKKISDGEKEYYNEDVPKTNNNLAFNIEDNGINDKFYRFLKPLDEENKTLANYTAIESMSKEEWAGLPKMSDGDVNDMLYNIDLQASKILSSELDLEGIEIDNIAEIIKVTNTAGRKVYVQSAITTTTGVDGCPPGNIGNTTIKNIGGIHKKDPVLDIVKVANVETDTDFSEYVTFSPPTGLNKKASVVTTVAQKAGNIILIIVPVIIIIAGGTYVTVQFVKRKKFYK